MGEVNRSMRNKKLAQRAGLPRRVKEMSKEQLETALLKKRECNTKALIIVERLLENTVSEDWFLESLKFISDTHFQDIIEERVILRLCGYPLCHQSLKNIPTQQYRISTKLNKVYDISERKNFCSNQCYKAGKYIKDQLLTSPLWLRDKEEIPEFKVLPGGTSGTGAGEEVDIGQNNSNLKDEVAQLENDNFTSVAQFTQDSLSKLSRKIDKLEKKERKNENFEREMKESKEEIDPLQKNIRSEYNIKTSEDIKTNPDIEPKESNERTSSSNNVDSSRDTKLQGSDIIVLESSNVLNTSAITQATASFQNVCEDSARRKGKLGNDCVNIEGVQSRSNLELGDGLNYKNSQTESRSNTLEMKTHNASTASTRKKPVKKIKDRGNSKNSDKSREGKVDQDISPLTNPIINLEKCLHEWFTLDSMCFLFGEEKVKEMVLDKGECINEYYKGVGSTTRDASMHEKYNAICKRLNLLELQENKFDAEAIQLKPLPDYTVIREESKKLQIKVRAFYQGKTDFEVPQESRPEEKQEDDMPSTTLPLVDLHAQNALRRRIILDRLNRILPDLLRTFGMSSRDVTTDLRSLFCTFSLAAHNITFKPAEWSLLGLVIIKMLSIRDARLKMMLDTDQANKYQTMMLIAFNQDGGYLERLMAWLTDIDNILQKQPVSKGSEDFQKSFTNL